MDSEAKLFELRAGEQVYVDGIAFTATRDGLYRTSRGFLELTKISEAPCINGGN